MKTIALSAGHSDSDPGAVYNGLVERDIVEKLVADASDILRGHGVGVLNPPSSLNLPQTIAWINNRKDQVDVCCEIHINSFKDPNVGLGLEGWHYANSDESKNFAQFLVDAIAVESGMKKDRGVKDERMSTPWHLLGFVHRTIPLACLIECGFINTDEDRKILSSETGLYNISKGIARGILSYWGLNWVPPKPEILQESQELIKIRGELAVCREECQRKSDILAKISALLVL